MNSKPQVAPQEPKKNKRSKVDEESLWRIGRNIKAERARADLTQEELAERATLAVAQLARMERGEVDSGIVKYVRVARALNIEPSVLLQDVE